MNIRAWFAAAVAACATLALSLPATAQPVAPNTPSPNHPGRATYVARCASCHDNPGTTRAASFAHLTGLSTIQLNAALEEGGVMAPMAAGIPEREVRQLIAYLTSGQRQAVSGAWAETMMCAADNRSVDASRPVAFSGFGAGLRSTRNLSARQSGLTKAGLGRLEVAWAIGFPGVQGLGSGVVVLGDTAFVSAAGKLLALDATKGCARWVADVASRNTPQIADIGGRKALVLTAGRGDLVVIDARTGETLWKADARPANGVGGVRGGVVVYKDKIIVPISASGVGQGQSATFECCTGHGAVVALSASDGKRLWEYHTMPDATYNGQVSRTGVKQRGPSGAPIWTLATIDEKRNRVIVATGENTSHPATDTSDAIIALDLDTGRQAWLFQAMKADVWNMACNDRDLEKSGPNCPNLFGEPVGRDFDFGATPMLLSVAGRDIVVNGQKSGHVWALDAATGKLLWQDRIGEGATLGGVHWGVASDGALAFVPISDSQFTEQEQPRNRAGVYAYRLSDGRQVWAHRAAPECGGGRAANLVRCATKFGYSAAPLTIDGAVVAATLDAKVVVLDGKTGQVLTSVDTAGPIQTLNGVPGRGGSIDAHALSAGAGMVFVTSGYGAFNQTPGNVLIALRPKTGSSGDGK